MFHPVDWGKVFAFDTAPLEIFVRGTIVYLLLFVMFRFVLKREAGQVGIADLLVVVIVADAAQNAMAGDYVSVPDGIVLVGTIALWNYLLDWLGYRFAWFERVLHPPPLQLIRDGKVLRRNLRAEMITTAELESKLREAGVEHLSDVRSACVVGDGQISVVKREKKDDDDGGPPKRPAG